MSYDAIVVGLGGVGSFALRALSKHTRNILGLEQFSLLHRKGSSHGGSRIYRQAYFEHANYVPLIRYSMQEFQAIQSATGMQLLEPCGTLLLEEEGGPVIPTCIKSAEQHDVATEKLSSQEVQERYPLFPNANLSGLLEPGGGFVRPETAMYAALSEAKARGATLWEKATVQSIEETTSESDGDHVHVCVQREGHTFSVTAKKSV